MNHIRVTCNDIFLGRPVDNGFQRGAKNFFGPFKLASDALQSYYEFRLPIKVVDSHKIQGTEEFIRFRGGTR